MRTTRRSDVSGRRQPTDGHAKRRASRAILGTASVGSADAA
jgi:hypothetical protein